MVQYVICALTIRHSNYLNTSKVDVPNSMSILKHTPTFELCMVWCKTKNKHQKIMC